MEKGKLTISKISSAENYVAVTIRLPDRCVIAHVSPETFAQALFGVSDVDCATRTKVGRFHGADKSIKEQS